MKYKAIDSKLFIKNRSKLVKQLKKNSLAVFTSNDIMPTNADGSMPFRQNNNLFYLSGVDQEDSILVVYPDCPIKKNREVLFLKKTSDAIAIWEGEKLTKEAAFETAGIKTVYWMEDFEKVFQTMAFEAENIYLSDNEHLRASNPVQTREDRFREWCMKTYPIHNYERSAPIVSYLRSVKEPVEIEMMQKACDITAKGVDRVLKFVKPGVMEFDIEAELMHEFLRNRSRGFAYEPIVASGFNACVLHYVQNNQECKDGDVILMDIGAEYGNYASDLTRAIPVNGKFTKRQKEVYNAVLDVMKGCEEMLKIGVSLPDYHEKVGHLMEKQLIKLGLLTQKEIDNQDPDWPAYKKYFMHGTSHYIGLDVHDVGSWTDPIEEGMVFTIEPGIYIREENLGIRLENDYLVTKNGLENLMAHIPIEAEDVEAAMKS